jgi:hypothetical protein
MGASVDAQKPDIFVLNCQLFRTNILHFAQIPLLGALIKHQTSNLKPQTSNIKYQATNNRQQTTKTKMLQSH